MGSQASLLPLLIRTIFSLSRDQGHFISFPQIHIAQMVSFPQWVIRIVMNFSISTHKTLYK